VNDLAEHGGTIVAVHKRMRGWAVRVLAALVGSGVFCCGVGLGADIDDARQLFLTGNYTEAARISEIECKDKDYSEQWPLLLVESLNAIGRYEAAYAVLTNRLARESRSIRLRWVGREVCRATGRPVEGDKLLEEIVNLVASRPYAYRDVADIVVFGRALLALGTDPKLVLDRVYEVAKKTEPGAREPYLAIGELALEKHDFALAARVFQEGLSKHKKDAEFHYGLARAYEPSDSALMVSALESALSYNSNHVSSILLLADRAIDAEDYEGATRLIRRVHGINSAHAEAWAYMAVIGRLNNRRELEQEALGKALALWPTNPRVPYLVGRKLSQKYRFAEGAQFQRRAIEFDDRFLPAKAQLAEDLLRLGEEEEGWRLAEQVHEKDGYDVTALNLVTLRDTLSGFAILTNSHFVVRMPKEESAVYGQRVVELLEEARERLCKKYGVVFGKPVKVEIFAHQSDFAVRTFGLPENHGFLGVCFGPVITANSPSARPGRPFNWEAMLWHEFCHAVTLRVTSNCMPRWLSEGLSVYEERQANGAWGEKMTPRYREMILSGELTPLSRLSGAFLAPKSPLHLQFAYYESSLAVEFLAEKFGFECLLEILGDLGNGMDVNKAIASRAAPLEQLEGEFEEFARRRATEFGSGLEWRRPPEEVLLTGIGSGAWESWARDNPDNYWVLMRRATQAIGAKQWNEAKQVLEFLIKRCPKATGSESPLGLLAQVHRELGETAEEREVLERIADQDGEAVEVYGRLMELGRAAGDWDAVIKNARRYIAVNPLVPLPYRHMAEAGERSGDSASAVRALRALLELDSLNLAETRFRLARQLWRAGDASARRELLLALEDVPLHRGGLELLLEMHSQSAGATNSGGAIAPAVSR